MTWLQAFVNRDLLNPSTLEGAVFYGVGFLLMAVLAARLIQAALLQPLKH